MEALAETTGGIELEVNADLIFIVVFTIQKERRTREEQIWRRWFEERKVHRHAR